MQVKVIRVVVEVIEEDRSQIQEFGALIKARMAGTEQGGGGMMDEDEDL